MGVKCDCEDWKYVDEIDGIITFAWTHHIEYKGPTFVYCPFCGRKLKKENEEGIISIEEARKRNRAIRYNREKEKWDKKLGEEE